MQTSKWKPWCSQISFHRNKKHDHKHTFFSLFVKKRIPLTHTFLVHKTVSPEHVSEPVPIFYLISANFFGGLTGAQHIMCFKNTKGYTLTFLTTRLKCRRFHFAAPSIKALRGHLVSMPSECLSPSLPLCLFLGRIYFTALSWNGRAIHKTSRIAPSVKSEIHVLRMDSFRGTKRKRIKTVMPHPSGLVEDILFPFPGL